jgi:hypothetical protein
MVVDTAPYVFTAVFVCLFQIPFQKHSNMRFRWVSRFDIFQQEDGHHQI